jgi:hypothetical protein
MQLQSPRYQNFSGKMVPSQMLLTGVAVHLGVTAGTSAPPPVPPVPAAMPKLLLGPGNAFGLFGVSNQES